MKRIRIFNYKEKNHEKKLMFIGIFSLVVLSLNYCSNDSPPVDEVYVLRNGTLIDGNGGQPIQNAVVITEGNFILYAGPASGADIPQGSTIIDASGMTILPGFFNSHIHKGWMVNNRRTWAREGVTTVLSLADQPEEIREARTDERIAEEARVLYAGLPMDITEGWLSSEWSFKFTSLEEARHIVEWWLGEEMGELIKLYLEDGRWLGLDPLLPVMSKEAIETIREASGRYGVEPISHINEVYIMEHVVDAGVRFFAHIPSGDVMSKQLLDKLVGIDACVIPTLRIIDGLGPTRRSTGMINVGLLLDNGIDIALGNDFDTAFDSEKGMPSVEMQFMQQAGMTNMQIIVSATKNGAYIAGLDHILGTVVSGKEADIIIVEGDPLTDLAILKNKMKLVMHYGQIIRNGLPTQQGPLEGIDDTTVKSINCQKELFIK